MPRISITDLDSRYLWTEVWKHSEKRNTKTTSELTENDFKDYYASIMQEKYI